MRRLFGLAPALLLGACMGASEPPVAAQAPAQAVPAGPVSASALPPAAGDQAAAAGRSGLGMAQAPGARESAGLSGVSRTSSGAATGSGLGGTIVGGQSAGLIPATVDRHREPPRRASAARDPMGPGTPPPVIQPEMRDQMGNTLRNRQRVEF